MSLCLIPDWRAIPVSEIIADTATALRDLSKINGLTLPAELDSEKLLIAFAGCLGVPVCDADIEAYQIFPNQRFASRAWLKGVYKDIFLPHCVQVKAIRPMAEPELVAGPFRPADEPVKAPVRNEAPKPKPKKKAKASVPDALPGWTVDKGTKPIAAKAAEEAMPGWSVEVPV